MPRLFCSNHFKLFEKEREKKESVTLVKREIIYKQDTMHMKYTNHDVLKEAKELDQLIHLTIGTSGHLLRF
jgi:hypothetical protein